MNKRKNEKKWFILEHLIKKELTEASQHLRKAQNTYQDSVKRHQQLEAYHQEYVKTCLERNERTFRPLVIENYEYFLNNLYDLLTHQKKVIHQTKLQLEKAQLVWSTVAIKQKNFRKYRLGHIKSALLDKERKADRS